MKFTEKHGAALAEYLQELGWDVYRQDNKARCPCCGYEQKLDWDFCPHCGSCHADNPCRDISADEERRTRISLAAAMQYAANQ